MKKIRMGVVNWDAGLPEDTYFGFYMIRSLSQARYRTRVPWYAKRLDGERFDCPPRTVGDYERELRYAIDAGIDYFAYVWYPTEGSLTHVPEAPNDCSHKVYELNHARRLYEQSSLKDSIGMCAILGAHPFADSDIGELVDAFTQPYYEKIDGRPLVYLFGGYDEALIRRVHALCRSRGVPLPYTVIRWLSAGKTPPMPLADALSGYAVANGTDADRYADLCRAAVEADVRRAESGMKVIPVFTAGWDPSPRIERPTPWTVNAEGRSIYARRRYAPPPTEAELTAGAKLFSRHIRTDLGDQFAGHILTFAWNEFEEGGYICPTYTEDGGIDDSRVRAFAEAARIFRSELDKA